MQQIRILFGYFLSLPLMFLFCGDAYSYPVSVTDLGVNNAEGAVAIGFNLVVQDRNAMLEALSSGGDYEVVCTGKLYNRRAGFWNEFLAEASYVCVLSANPIAREFRAQDSRGTRIFEFSELPQALDSFWSGLSLSMGNWDMIERNRVYKVVLSFKISRTNIPGWVSKPLFFVSWDLVPELIYEFEFDY